MCRLPLSVVLVAAISGCGGSSGGGFETGSGNYLEMDQEYRAMYSAVINSSEGNPATFPDSGSMTYNGHARGVINYSDQRAKQLELWGVSEVTLQFGASSSVRGVIDEFVGVNDSDYDNPIYFSGGISLRNGEVNGNEFDFAYSGELHGSGEVVTFDGTNGSGTIRGQGGTGIIGSLRSGIAGSDGLISFTGGPVSQSALFIVATCDGGGCPSSTSAAVTQD